MSWQVTTSTSFDKAAKKLDRAIAARIFKALYALAKLEDPTTRCKALSGPLKGLWRLRVGDWRVILDIQHSKVTIIALQLGHRSEIYD